MGDKMNSTGERNGRLTPEIIAQVMTSLEEVGDYGEVHLVVEKGRVRFIRSVKSMDAPLNHEE